ncbi:MAG TPA: prolyl oligopeptidase family serine peptidase, partial [Candidatus Acidoferrales bacterium]|nr:prolyl oligopeptidase family serine peptidase [Candidatus Acidoferrales bacterium]
VSSARWSPDATRLAFLGTVVADADGVVEDPRPPRSDEEAHRPPVARVASRLDYKHDLTGYADGRHQHLFVVAAEGGEPKQLTSGPWSVAAFDWAPDGGRLVVAADAEPDSDLRRELNLYLIGTDGSRQRLASDMYLSSPSWSPKGDLIAFLAPTGREAGMLERVWVVPAAGGDPRCLTESLDLAAGDGIITDMRAGHGVRIAWSAEGDRVYFTASGPGVTGLLSVDLAGQVRQEVGGQRKVYDFDVRGGVIAFCASDPAQPGELFVQRGGSETPLTRLNPWLAERQLALPERMQFTGADGWAIEGWLLKPEGFDPSRKYPLVLQVHGGPHGQYGWAFFHEFQILTGKGFLVLCCNPRGSDGYGETFRRAVVGDWGGKDFQDLMAALDQVAALGYVDTARMGIAGGSYGGFMTNWVVGQTDRFAAAVSMRSISNLVSEYAQHDIVIWGMLELGPPPWPNADELWKRSPIRYVQNVRTPLLLLHSEMDLRCAISQAEELFGALRLLGKTVELVRFPGESHDLSRGGRPDRRVERLRRIEGWFERFLAPAPAAPAEVAAAAEPAPPEPAPAPPEPMPVAAPEPVPVAPAAWEPVAPAAPEPVAAVPVVASEPATDGPAAAALPSLEDVHATMVLPTAAPAPGAPAPAAPPAPAPAPAPAGTLLVEAGPLRGREMPLGATTLRVGRAPDNELIFLDPVTSGHHARFELRGTAFHIVDLGSTNGTLVNGEPVVDKELKHGDQIVIGQNLLKFILA